MVTVTSLPGGPCLEWAEDKRALAPELSPAVRACLSLLSRTQMFPQQKGTALPPEPLCVILSPDLPFPCTSSTEIRVGAEGNALAPAQARFLTFNAHSSKG